MIFYVLITLLVSIIFVIKIFQKVTHRVCLSSAHMIGKVVIITGGNSGIGFETAKNLAERGARVIIACRSVRRAEDAIKKIIEATGNKDVEYRHLDLASFRSVRKFSENILKTEQRLDVLINNAAAGGLGNYKTEDGNHIGMQVNYYGTFLLTNLLLPLLKSSAPSRIINVSSMIHKYAEMDFENLNMEKYWSDYLVYANSKLYLNLMTIELSRRLQGTNVTVNALHPGVAATNNLKIIKTDIIHSFLKFFITFMYLNVWEAAQTSIYLAVSPEVQNVSGRYFSNCKEEKPSKMSQDIEVAKRLWNETERIVNFSLNKYNRCMISRS